MKNASTFYHKNREKKGAQSVVWAIIGGFALSIALTSIIFSGFLSDANLTLSDKIYQRERMLEGNIFVLGIDELALSEMGPFQKWTRATMAEVIEKLNSVEGAKPAVIGIDVMYYGENDPEGDKMLADACGKYDNVVNASRVVFGSGIVEKGDEFYVDNAQIKQIELPYRSLLAEASIGHINTMADKDGVVRHAFQYIDLPQDIAEQMGNSTSESFALQIYKKYNESLGLGNSANPPLGKRNEWYIPYSSKPGGYGDGFSVWDLLNGDLPPELFADTIVLIGPYTEGLMDSFITPIDRTKPMYGVEVHANIIDAMLKNEYRKYAPINMEIIMTGVIIFSLFLIFYFTNITFSTICFVTVNGLYFLIANWLVFPPVDSWFLFSGDAQYRLMLSPLYIPLATFILYVAMVAVNLFREAKQRHLVTDTFKRYVDPAIIEDIFKDGMDDLKLGGKKTDICVMFMDIRGFTPLSENLSPEEVVRILGDCLKLTSDGIFKYKGTLDKFIGDSTMAIFNAPMPMDDYIYKAVLTAWDVVQAGIELEKKLKEEYGYSVAYGIGIHCGEAVVGNIGTPRRVDYTAIGNTVNTAARLESNARPHQILMSEDVYRAVEDRVVARCMGNIPLKGKSQEITVYALEHIKEFMDTQEPLISAQIMPGKD